MEASLPLTIFGQRQPLPNELYMSPSNLTVHQLTFSFNRPLFHANSYLWKASSHTRYRSATASFRDTDTEVAAAPRSVINRWADTLSASIALLRSLSVASSLCNIKYTFLLPRSRNLTQMNRMPVLLVGKKSSAEGELMGV